jgi:hypothetical protein
MSVVRLAIIGAGSIRCSPPVIGTLATHYGERPLEVVLYDSDADRLNLFDYFARFCFLAMNSTHSVRMTTDPAVALEGADKVILQMDENCAQKLLARPEGPALDEALEVIYPLIPPAAEVMSLLLNRELPLYEYRAMDWPGPLSEDELLSIPYQILRYLNQEDYLYDVLKAGKESPLRPWLELPVRTL